MSSFLNNLTPLKGTLSQVKERAWDKLCTLGLPEKKTENYQYVPIQALYSEKFTLPVTSQIVKKDDIAILQLKECQGACLTFVNGSFRPDLSCKENLPSSLLILPFSEAEKPFGGFIKGRNDCFVEEEKDPLALLSFAFQQEGLFLYLPPKVRLNTPIQILHIFDEENKALFSPRITLFLGKDSHLQLYTKELYLKPCNGWVNSLLDIILEEKASLFHGAFFEKQESMFHTNAIRITQKKESSLETLSFGYGKKLFRQDFYTSCAYRAKSSLGGAFRLNEKNEAHIHTFVDHKDEEATSMQKFKGILNGSSRLSFTGKIFVRKEALRTQAYQLNNNLILSDKARVYSKPNLEIFADDVKASHGATIGRLNAEDLFYLTSKGIPQDLAKHLLIEGFYREMLNLVPITSLRQL